MIEAPYEDFSWFCFGCWCLPCANYFLRKQALGPDWPKNYTCCQSFFGCGSCTGGSCGEQSCPDACLCLESCFCASCALSATRFYVLDKYNLIPDPMDNKIIRFNNCLQILACILDIVAIFVPAVDKPSDYIDLIAKIVFHITAGMMVAQVHYELNIDGAPGSGGTKPKGAPVVEMVMDR